MALKNHYMKPGRIVFGVARFKRFEHGGEFILEEFETAKEAEVAAAETTEPLSCSHILRIEYLNSVDFSIVKQKRFFKTNS